MEGSLLKRGDWGKWTKRFFAIRGTSLLYFNDASDVNHRTAFALK